jgi:hypothetical protein
MLDRLIVIYIPSPEYLGANVRFERQSAVEIAATLKKDISEQSDPPLCDELDSHRNAGTCNRTLTERLLSVRMYKRTWVVFSVTQGKSTLGQACCRSHAFKSMSAAFHLGY